MKKTTLKLAMITGLATSVLFSCGGSTAEQVETSDAVKIEATDASSGSFSIDASSSKVGWIGYGVGKSHNGTFSLKEGSLAVSDGKIMGGNFLIDMASVTVDDIGPEQGQQKLVNHLLGTKEEDANHFFNTSKYPTAEFVISSVEEKAEGDNTHIITGNLRIKETTKNISFPAKVVVTENTITASAPKFSIDRTEWDVSYNTGKAGADLGKYLIQDNVDLSIELTAAKGDKVM